MAKTVFDSRVPIASQAIINEQIFTPYESKRQQDVFEKAYRFDYNPSSEEGKNYFLKCIGGMAYRFGSNSFSNEPHALDKALTEYHTSEIFAELGYNDKRSNYASYISVGCVPHKERLQHLVHGVSFHSISDTERFETSHRILIDRVARWEHEYTINHHKWDDAAIKNHSIKIHNNVQFVESIINRPNVINTKMCWSGVNLCDCNHPLAKVAIAVHSVYNINPYNFVCFLEKKSISTAYVVLQVFPATLRNCDFSDWCYSIRMLSTRVDAPPDKFSVKFNGDCQEEYIHDLFNYRAWISLTYIQGKKYYWKVTPIRQTGSIYTFKVTKFKDTILLGNTFDNQLKNAAIMDKRNNTQNPFKKEFYTGGTKVIRNYVDNETLIRSYSLDGYVLVPDGVHLMNYIKNGALKMVAKSVGIKYHKVPVNEWNKLTSFLQSLAAGDFELNKAKSMFRALGSTIWFGTTKINQSVEVSMNTMTGVVTTAYIMAAAARATESRVIATAFAQLKKEQDFLDHPLMRWWNNFCQNAWWNNIKESDAISQTVREASYLHDLAVVKEISLVDEFKHSGKFYHSVMVQQALKYYFQESEVITTEDEFLKLYLSRLEKVSSESDYKNLIEQVMKNIDTRRDIMKEKMALKPDDIVFGIGVAGSGKTSTLFSGVRNEECEIWPGEKKDTYEARKDGNFIFVAPSAAAALEIREKYPKMAGSGVAQSIFTQHNVFQANKRHVPLVVVDECFTYPKGYFIALKCKFPDAQMILLGDINQCGLYDDNEPYRTDESIAAWLSSYPRKLFTKSQSIPKVIAKFLTDAGCKTETNSEVEGYLAFNNLPQDGESLMPYDCVMTISRDDKEYYKTLIEDYVKAKDFKGAVPPVYTVREAQGMRCKAGCFIITQPDTKFITSQHKMVYVAFTRTTESLVVMTKDKNMLKYNINLDFCKIEQNWFVLSNFIPYDTQTFDEEPEFVTAYVSEVERAPLCNDYVAISNILIKASDLPEDTSPSQLSVTPQTFILSLGKQGSINRDILNKKQPIEFLTGYALPVPKHCKYYKANDPAQTMACMTERYGDTKNKPKVLTPEDKKAAEYMFARFKERFLDDEKQRELLSPGGELTQSHSRYFEQMNIAAAQYLDKVREKGTAHFISPIEDFTKQDLLVDFCQKDIIKQSSLGATTEKEGQGISAWSKNLNSVMCVMHRVIATALIQVLKPNVILGYESSRDQQGDQFMMAAREKFMEFCTDEYESASVEQMATDISAFDRTQDLMTQHFERLVINYVLNIGEETTAPLLDRYFELRANYVMQYKKYSREDMGLMLKLYINGMKASGEPSTLGMNTLLNMGMFATITNVEDEIITLFTGDDSTGCAKKYDTNPIGVKLVSRLIGAPVKYEGGNIKRFTGYFLTPDHGNVHDWVTTARKLISQLYRNETHYNEYLTSIKDLLVMANRVDDKIAAKVNSLYYPKLSIADMMLVIGWVRNYVLMSWNEFINNGAEHTTVNSQCTFFVDVGRLDRKELVKFNVSDMDYLMEHLYKLKSSKFWECKNCNGAWNDRPCANRKKTKAGFFCVSCSIKISSTSRMHLCNSCRGKVNEDLTAIGKCCLCAHEVLTNLQLRYCSLNFVCPVHIEKGYAKHCPNFKYQSKLCNIATYICSKPMEKMERLKPLLVSIDDPDKTTEELAYFGHIMSLRCDQAKDPATLSRITKVLTNFPSARLDSVNKMLELEEKRELAVSCLTSESSTELETGSEAMPCSTRSNSSTRSEEIESEVSEISESLPYAKISQLISQGVTVKQAIAKLSAERKAKADSVWDKAQKKKNKKKGKTKYSVLNANAPEFIPSDQFFSADEEAKIHNELVGRVEKKLHLQNEKRNKDLQELVNKVTKASEPSETMQEKKKFRVYGDKILTRVPNDTLDCFWDAANHLSLQAGKELFSKEDLYTYINDYRINHNYQIEREVDIDEGCNYLKDRRFKFAMFVQCAEDDKVRLQAAYTTRITKDTIFDCIIMLGEKARHFMPRQKFELDPADYELATDGYVFDEENQLPKLGTNKELQNYLQDKEPWPNLNRWKQSKEDKPAARTDIKMAAIMHTVDYQRKHSKDLLIMGAAAKEGELTCPMLMYPEIDHFVHIDCVDPAYPRTQEGEPVSFYKDTIQSFQPRSNRSYILIVSDIYNTNSINNFVPELVKILDDRNITSGDSEIVNIAFKITTQNLALDPLSDEFLKFFPHLTIMANPGSQNSTEVWFLVRGYKRSNQIDRNLSAQYLMLQDHRNNCDGCRNPKLEMVNTLEDDGLTRVITFCAK